MHVVATLLVRDEAEIVRQCIEHHLQHGVDGFIVTDNGSVDGTRDILASCPGILKIIDEPKHNHHQAKWVTRMARHACKYDPSWLVHLDADEFWCGLDILHDPARLRGVGVVIVTRELVHVPIPGLEFGKFQREQMPYYRYVSRPMPKVIHRAAESVHVSHGNHIVSGVPGRHAHTPKGVHIHHYPIRSYEHLEAKTIKGGRALKHHPGPSGHGKRWRGWYKLYKQGLLPEFYAERLYTPDKIEEGLKLGTLKVYSQEVELAHARR
jgi:hypothetical protein